MRNVNFTAQLAAIAVFSGVFGLALPASADTFNVQYFEVPAGSPDFYNGGTHSLEYRTTTSPRL